ncbi:urease accessory protein UreE [Parvibaculum sp.]|uniref:urease accessory protein UreE n=1 Tax=Parvibaculum sp. TaxID=2024848 RepID=UPI002C685DD5|nr:urease accessory protein UreE [Parvibaculum sp.]HUD50533.1 urease accessory protein UreE [Parvibaculum sp.]
MKRVIQILKGWAGAVSDDILLDFQDRHRRRIVLTAAKGTEFILDLSEVPDLRDGDGLRLSSGETVLVRAAPEALMEITCSDPLHLARIAWHLGNRHLPTEIAEKRLRIRADHVIADMVLGLGGEVRSLDAPFDPEGGAYGGAASAYHGHRHSHDDDHDHDHHDHHHHGHAHGHSHGHG